MPFASKSLNHAQYKYPAHQLAFFAMKWDICNKLSQCLLWSQVHCEDKQQPAEVSW